MNYDIWGSWDTTVGPNAPLNDTCAASPQGSAVSAVKAWSAAGFPANRIILGVASYGHSFHVNPTDAVDASGNIKPYPPFDKSQQPAGDKWDSTATGVDVCGNPNVVGGVFDFWGLIDGGFLTAQGTVANGIDYTLDNCSVTVRAFVLVDEMGFFSDTDFFLSRTSTILRRK
jgi:chitinase